MTIQYSFPGNPEPFSPYYFAKTIKSYLYQQYFYDSDLQSLVLGYNTVTQNYVDWFNSASLPIYPLLSGALLDWVGNGLYGVKRPILYHGGLPSVIGELSGIIGELSGAIGDPSIGVGGEPVSDDVYKRLLTWLFHKGDGAEFSIPWLKRRIYRFMLGTNGIDVAEGFTDLVSIRFELPYTTASVVKRFGLTGAITCGPITLLPIAAAKTYAESVDENTYSRYVNCRIRWSGSPDLVQILQDLANSGVLNLPFQFNYDIQVA